MSAVIVTRLPRVFYNQTAHEHGSQHSSPQHVPQSQSTDTSVNAQEASQLPKTLQDVSVAYFAADKLADGVKLVEHISTFATPIFNWDVASGDFPDTHGMLVLPIGETVDEIKDGKKTGDKVRVTKNVVVAAVPTLDSLLSDAKGREYVERSTIAAYSAKIRNTLVRAEDVASVKLPFSVADFIERSERGAADQGLASFKAIGPKLVQSLKKKGVDINLPLLRQVLQSASFAKALMPKVAQAVWVKVIEAGRAKAEEQKMATTIFDHWKATREQAVVETEMADIDLD